MKKQWQDPAKRPASEKTLQTQGDFGRFTDVMKQIVNKKPGAKTTSPGPVAS
jgi:hypothetical protein